MNDFALSCAPILALLAASILALSAAPSRAAEETNPKGPAVTVLKATKSCFAAIVELSGPSWRGTRPRCGPSETG